MLKKLFAFPEEGFGTMSGVYVPSILMMFGVIVFLRLGLVTSYLGPLGITGIIALALLVMIITSKSISAIVTNMRVGSGGIYYLVSRALGLEIGGAIGILLYLCQIISIALCTSGFAIAFCDAFPWASVHLVEVCALSMLTLLSFFSTDLAMRVQYLILVILIAAFGSALLGSYEGVEQTSKPLFFPEGISFWHGFALIYPALTGIEAGMAMSGTLKDPSKSLSKGTFYALLTSGSVYLLFSLFLYFSIPTNELQRDPLILLNFGKVPSLIIAGIWGATLSSVLASLLGAPRMLQAIADDGVIWDIFSKTYGEKQEPRYAIALTYIVALVLMLFTTMDQIIPILTMICLLSYGALNLVTSVCELMNSPSWRPLQRTHWALALFGAFMCFSYMLFIDVAWSFAAVVLVILAYVLLKRAQIETSFEDIRESIIFFFSRHAIYKLSEPSESAQHWHPQVLAFLASPRPQEKFVHLCSSLTKQDGILTFATLIPADFTTDDTLPTRKRALEEYYAKKGINCLVEMQQFDSINAGIEGMIKSYGLGAFQPNTIALPYEGTSPLRSLRVASENQKNCILFQESESVPARTFIRRSTKRIDVWWDIEERTSFELMISLTNAICCDPIWKGVKMNLHTTCPSDDAKTHVFEHIKGFLSRSRLAFRPHIHTVKSPELFWKTVSKTSKDADLTFIALPPLDMFESEDVFEEYFSEMTKGTSTLKACAYVQCNDSVDHSEIYEYHEE